MLSQALEIFKHEYGDEIDKIIIDAHIPADGTYVKINIENNVFNIDEICDIKQDKKTRQVDRSGKNFDFFCYADYYSRVSDMNKAILSAAGKVIQGNNYQAFIVKKETLTNGKLKEELIDKFFDFLKEPRLKYPKKSKAKSLELYEVAESELGEVDQDRVETIRNWLKENLFKEFGKFQGKDYLKIFFEFSEDNYRESFKQEGLRYLIPNVFNNNDYNVKSGDSILGLPNDNMGMNSKKPYLEMKTRKQVRPYLIDFKEALDQKKLFDFLMNKVSAGKRNIYLGESIKALSDKEMLDEDFQGMFLRIKKGKELEIIDQDIITSYRTNLRKEFEYKNILDVKPEILSGDYDRHKNIATLAKIINEVYFSKYLTTNYFTEPGDIKINDSILKENILICRNTLFDWFYKGKTNGVFGCLDRASSRLVKNCIVRGNYKRACNQFNLKKSLQEYFKGGENMADIIKDTKDRLREKIALKETGVIQCDKEYCFAVGQLVSFFISKSKGKNKPLSLANPFINAKNQKIIKEKLRALYKKYNYDIESYAVRFKNLYSMVAAYEIENNIDEDMIIAGYLNSNLIYESSKQKEEV